MSLIFMSHSSRDNRQGLALKKWLAEQRPELANEIFLDDYRVSDSREHSPAGAHNPKFAELVRSGGLVHGDRFRPLPVVTKTRGAMKGQLSSLGTLPPGITR